MRNEGSSTWQQQLAPQNDYTTTPIAFDNTMTTTEDQSYHEEDFVDFDGGGDEDPYAQGSTSNAESERPYVCMHCDEKKNTICGKAYPRQCDLTKHQNNHLKKHHCGICSYEQWAGGAERKDLDRHMWSTHRDRARAQGLKEDKKRCPYCGYKGRTDNVKRHMEKCPKKH